MKALIVLLAGLVLNPAVALAADNFSPIETPTAVTASTSSSNTSFSLTAAINAPDVKVCNTGGTLIYWACGNTSVQATVPGAGSSSTPLAAGLCGAYHKGTSTTCAAITTSGSSTATFTAGEGQ
jgi:hypothetical protein